jgi:hypothetical protein
MPPRQRRRRDQDDDEEEELHHGERRSRHGTSWQHRDTSSLSQLEMVDRDYYFNLAEDMIQKSVQLLPIISSIFMTLSRYYLIVQQGTTLGSTIAANVVSHARAKMIQCKEAFDSLTFLLSWIRSYCQIALLYAEDLTFFSRGPHRFAPECKRTMDSISGHECYTWFGVYPEQLQETHRMKFLRSSDTCTIWSTASSRGMSKL